MLMHIYVCVCCLLLLITTIVCMPCSEVDWWSLGVVCFELLTGWPPFFDRDFDKMCEKILRRPLRFPSKVCTVLH